MRILRASDYQAMPWKNGGGVTTEIAVSPPGAGLDTFDWRISMANVASPGPFSQFPGIDRTLSILSGEGIVLAVDGRKPVILNRGSAPHFFPADSAASADLIAGPVTDLNIMTRRARIRHRVEKFRISAPLDLSAEGGTCLVLCHEGQMSVGNSSIEAGDTLWTTTADRTARMVPAEPTTVFLIRIHAIDAFD